MRVVAGKIKGRQIKSPTDERTRPTSDRAREALFNILNAYLMKKEKSWDDISFLDVFSGTGAVGIEAHSRGAHKVQLIENYLPALDVLTQNIEGLENVYVLKCDATNPPFTTKPMDMIFLDAPYREELWEKALQALVHKGWIDQETYIVIEIEKTEEGILPLNFEKIDDRFYGRNRFLLCKYVKTV